MKPLVMYCRWQRARLYLRGRDAEAVWGELGYEDGARRRFNYDLASRRLALGQGKNAERWQLDEMGVATPAAAEDAG
jgi:hypothetical protein